MNCEYHYSQDQFAEYLSRGRSFLNSNIALPVERLHGHKEHLPLDAANYALDLSNERRKLSLVPLCLASDFGVHWREMIPIVQSTEYVHTGTLILDDLPQLDNDLMRRGKASTHIAFGEPAVHHASGLLLMHSAISLTYLPASKNVISKLQGLLLSSFEDTALGQLQELELKYLENVPLEELENISDLKTSALFRYLLGSVMLYVEASERAVKDVMHIAHHAGIAYQLKNDLLDAEAKDVHEIGKIPDGDRLNGRPTYYSTIGKDGIHDRSAHHREAMKQFLNSLPVELPTAFQMLDSITSMP